MYKRIGICWHTGYRFTHYITREEADKDLPPIRRMKNRILSKDEKKEKEHA